VEEAEYAARKGYSKHTHPKPLYDLKDVDKVLPRMHGYMFDKTINLTDKVSIVFRNASHILGAAIVEVFIHGDHQDKKIVFSGDIGRYNNPILYPPHQVKQADILLIESTYGTRSNPFIDPKEGLAKIITKTFEAGGCVLIPAFAVGRTQNILFYLKELMDNNMIDEVPIYMDSPMAITTTGLYKNHFEYHKLDEDELKYEESFVNNKNLHLVTQQADSVALNKIKSRAIIISASGMLNGGRILHHLYNRLPRTNDTLLLVGYQAEGTRGRRIVDGELEIRIFGENVPLRCRVEQVDGLSAHADKTELHQWLSGFEDSPKMTYVVHGERPSAHGFAKDIKETFGWNAKAPEYLESAELFRGI
jgi:metallo-beta-lactamase family protein